MSFIDNSGDILLDMVLTDTGRMRLAKGEFRIAKFALFDEEINYGLYEKGNASGSAYFDLSILQTPILEAFTNNTSYGRSKLLSIPRTNLLYLPIVQVNENAGGTAQNSVGSFVVATDKASEDALPVASDNGILKGENPVDGTYIRVDQGLDTTEISPASTLDADLVETQYIIEMDNRFGGLVSVASSSPAQPSFIDDDHIASYFLSLGTDPEFVESNKDRTASGTQTIDGPRGTILKFRVRSSIELNTSTFLFTKLGDTSTLSSVSVYHIDTVIRVSGVTTGFSVDIPVRFVKKV